MKRFMFSFVCLVILSGALVGCGKTTTTTSTSVKNYGTDTVVTTTTVTTIHTPPATLPSASVEAMSTVETKPVTTGFWHRWL